MDCLPARGMVLLSELQSSKQHGKGRVGAHGGSPRLSAAAPYHQRQLSSRHLASARAFCASWVPVAHSLQALAGLGSILAFDEFFVHPFHQEENPLGPHQADCLTYFLEEKLEHDIDEESEDKSVKHGIQVFFQMGKKAGGGVYAENGSVKVSPLGPLVSKASSVETLFLESSNNEGGAKVRVVAGQYENMSTPVQGNFVPCSILQPFWAKHFCSDQRCSSKSVKIDASALRIVQVAFNDLVKHALRFHLYFKNLQSQLREPEIFKSSPSYDWLKLICSLHQNLKMKTIIVILGSVMASMLIMVGAPGTSPNSVTWALTEENLIFLEAWRTIDRAYIDKTFNGQSWFRYREEALRREPMNNREQTYAAIRKMLMTLEDPFTRFLEPEKFKTLRTGTRGAVTGVGLEVGFESNGANADLVVIAPVIGGPAERVGIVPGDIIREIDGMSTNGLGLYEAAQRLQGPESSEVKLTVQKKESRSSNNIVLVREKIKINPVSWRLCEVVEEEKKSVQIGYIRLATFNENASRSIKEAIQKLKESGATAYILDMRNNSGGLFPAGIEIAKMWLEKGVIVYITDSKGIRDIYEADGYGTIATNEPLAVLVNKGTASASEILAGALKDNKRAAILGEPTFGKGKIQSVFQLSDGSGMAVTVARYETPAHVDIDKVGITPDHSLPVSAPLDKEDFCRCLIDPSLPCYMSPSIFFPS